MKISFITDEATQSFDTAIAIAKKCCLNGLELRSVEDTPIDAVSRSVLHQYKKKLNAHSLAVPCLASSFYKCDTTDTIRLNAELEKLKRLCDAADILDCENIRGFAFFRPTCTGQPLEEIAPYFEQAVEILCKRKKVLLLESDPCVNTTNHASLAKLLSILNNNCFKAIYDPGNDLYDPEREQAFPFGYEAIKPYLVHVHIKDVIYDDRGEPMCVKVGAGNVGYPALLKRLLADGYNGWLSLETHYRKNATLTQEQMRLPQGVTFSAGGEQAMEESAFALKEMLSIATGGV